MQAKYLAALFGALLLAGCSNDMTSPRQPPRELTKTESQIVQSDNAFGFELMRKLNAGQMDSNVIISPLSVSMALGMTLNGARGTTEEGMRSTLGFQGLSSEEINNGYRNLIDMLSGLDPKVKFQIANSIWHRNTFQARQEFYDANRRFFDAEVAGLDFSASSTSNTINEWVKGKTNGKIPAIVPRQIPSGVIMYLINAIYFKGTWTNKFDPKQTRPADFTRPDGSRVQVQMMNRQAETKYVQNARFSAVDLPYGDSNFSMTIILPTTGTTPDALLDGFTSDDWKTLHTGMAKQDLMLSIPRFTIEYGKNLNDALKAMGMQVAFSSNADLSGIGGEPGDLYISNVEHKTFIEVNEEGTEAAAATSVEISRTSLGPTMRVDRPFIFAIRENHTGAILFLGKIASPVK